MAESSNIIEIGERSEIVRGAKNYPKMLDQVDSPPERLYCIGNTKCLTLMPGLAIVGARTATPYGLACAERFASMAADLGITVVSGGAIGCDQAAHRGALNNRGKTVVVLGSGANVAYPRRAKSLFERVIESGGVLVSELKWGSPPQRWEFRKRNRIIAGLAQAVLIVEAGLPSGTFSTADYALEAGKDVLAVPGSILSRESYGSNTLIYQGATPIIDDSTFITELNNIFKINQGFRIDAGGFIGEADSKHTRRQQVILKYLAASPQSPDELHQAIGGCKILDIIKDLSFLETEGFVKRYPDGSFGIAPHFR